MVVRKSFLGSEVKNYDMVVRKSFLGSEVKIRNTLAATDSARMIAQSDRGVAPWAALLGVGLIV
jgi:predicted DNA-binding protein (UPF0278 family)